MAKGSSVAVYSAIIGNFLVMICKFGAFFMSGSSAMLSAGIHSFADVANQSLLALGIHKSKKKADVNHPYGFSREQFVWALISATGIFFVGCGVTVYHGIHTILNPHPIHNYTINFIVLFISFILESIVLAIALKHSLSEAKRKNLKLMAYFSRNSDPMAMAVVLEDSAALLGIVIAGVGITLSYYTNNFIWDGVATLIIGVLLGFVALALIAKTKGLLLGKAVHQSDYKKTLSLLKSDKIINKVYDVKSVIIGTDSVRFKAEIDFDGKELTKKFLKSKCDVKADFNNIDNESDFEEYLVNFGDKIIDKVGKEINRIEEKIQKDNPDIKHIDLETH
jgi:zinc transporter 9